MKGTHDSSNYPLINHRSSLRIECTLLLYKSLIRSLITYVCPVWSNTSKTNKNKLQVLQNEIFRIATNAPWFVGNDQLREELTIADIETFIKKCTKAFIKKMQHCEIIIELNIGQKNLHTCLKRKLPIDIYSSTSEQETEKEQ